MKCKCGKKMVKISDYIADWRWCKNCGRLCDLSNLNDLEDTWYDPDLEDTWYDPELVE